MRGGARYDTQPRAAAHDARSRAILAFIASYTAAHYGLPPTLRECAAACRLSKGGAIEYHLHAMLAEGLIEWEPGRARTLRLTPKGAPRTPLSKPLGVDPTGCIGSFRTAHHRVFVLDEDGLPEAPTATGDPRQPRV